MNSDDTNHVVGLSIDSSSENNATSSAFSSSVLGASICQSVVVYPSMVTITHYSRFHQRLSEYVVAHATRPQYQTSDFLPSHRTSLKVDQGF